MKKLLLIAVAISFLIVSSCQNKVDVEKEKQAILEIEKNYKLKEEFETSKIL